MTELTEETTPHAIEEATPDKLVIFAWSGELDRMWPTLILATSGAAMTAVLGGLGVDGVLEVVGAPADPLQIPAYALISHRRSIAGWASGRPVDSEQTMAFAVQTGVRSMNEPFPLDRAPEAYDRMMSGKARFRVVLTMGLITPKEGEQGSGSDPGNTGIHD